MSHQQYPFIDHTTIDPRRLLPPPLHYNHPPHPYQRSNSHDAPFDNTHPRYPVYPSVSTQPYPHQRRPSASQSFFQNILAQVRGSLNSNSENHGGAYTHHHNTFQGPDLQSHGRSDEGPSHQSHDHNSMPTLTSSFHRPSLTSPPSNNHYVDLTHDPPPQPHLTSTMPPSARHQRVLKRQHHCQAASTSTPTTSGGSSASPPSGSAAKRRKRNSGRRGSNSADTPADGSSSSRPLDIDELDLVEESNNPLVPTLQKQRSEQVKAQEVPSDQPLRMGGLTCVICMDSPTDLTATSCGHLFCHTCIMEALIAGENRAGPGETKRSQCPVCRKTLNRTKASDVIPLLLMKKAQPKGRRGSKAKAG